VSKLTIEIDTDNAIFWNEDATPTGEVARILMTIANRYPYTAMREDLPIGDLNGNTVGHWRVEP
jgi:hypothetical protein